MKSTSNCLRQFPLAAEAALWRSTKFHAEECLKDGILPALHKLFVSVSPACLEVLIEKER